MSPDTDRPSSRSLLCSLAFFQLGQSYWRPNNRDCLRTGILVPLLDRGNKYHICTLKTVQGLGQSLGVLPPLGRTCMMWLLPPSPANLKCCFKAISYRMPSRCRKILLLLNPLCTSSAWCTLRDPMWSKCLWSRSAKTLSNSFIKLISRLMGL